MLVVHHIPWRALALPTPFLTALVVLVPTPFILIFNSISWLMRRRRQRSCRALIKRSAKAALLVYTQRPDSLPLVQSILEQQPQWQGVLVEHGRIPDRTLKAIESLLPRQLGGVYPLLVTLKDGCLEVESLHDAFYEQHMQVKPLEHV